MRLPIFLFLNILLLLSACKQAPETAGQFSRSSTLCAPRAIDAFAPIEGVLPLFEGLGNQQFSITTSSETAQQYFLQGFRLANAFNHLEATRSFRYAIMQDSTCAMCHWGLAYVLGPNYNAAFDATMLAYVREALQKAETYAAGATAKEQALIGAMQLRYPPTIDDDQKTYETAYAEAMRGVARQFPDDDNIQALLAEALMNLHPWDLWETDGRSKPWTPEILSILERTIARNPDHVATIHLYIHATEAALPRGVQQYSPYRALAHAGRLPALAPGAGHLVHMPSHTYIRTGDYHQGVLANQAAVAVDSGYVSACHAAGVYPLAYYPHNFHFLAACAALEGNAQTAVDASWRMVEKLDTAAMRQPGLETIQHYYSIPYYVLVKFARWDDILELPRPARDLNYPTAVWRYARGMAFAAKGQIAESQAELADLQLLQQDETTRNYSIWEINKVGALLDIAVDVLAGELAARQGKTGEAIRRLSAAVAIEDELAYNEPPDWFFSVRHQLGPVLLSAGRYAEAERLYRRDLELFPKNGFALSGLYEALQGQGKDKEAGEVKRQLEAAWQFADVKLAASTVAL